MRFESIEEMPLNRGLMVIVSTSHEKHALVDHAIILRGRVRTIKKVSGWEAKPLEARSLG